MAREAQVIGRRLHRYDRVESTNDVLRLLAEAGAVEGTVVVAREQSRGRGRRGRIWVSPRGGLWCSVLLRPADPADGRLALVAAVGVAEALRAVSGVDVRVKWPNDLVLDGGKVGGILIEAIPDAVVVGIGINLNVDLQALPEDLRAGARVLSTTSPRAIDDDAVLSAVLATFDRVYRDYAQGRADGVLDRWRSLSATLGRQVRVTAGDRVVAGHADDIAEDGALRIRTADGTLVRVYAGEVTA